jgi:zinc D-Ala-D-Ala dipeptidase
LVKIDPLGRIKPEPVWDIEDDFEGGFYKKYIAMHPEYNGIYLRPKVLRRLEEAAMSLDSRYRLIIRAGHRPIDVQKNELLGCMQDFKKNHSNVSDDEALRHARMFVSDPLIELPPHCCGAAVDVDVFDIKGNMLVDFGGRVNLEVDTSYLHSNKISQAQQDNRLMLLTVMLNAGFASTAFEWWHYSYGDQTWAWFYGHNNSLYGLIEL